jgi:hypothetical protein
MGISAKEGNKTSSVMNPGKKITWLLKLIISWHSTPSPTGYRGFYMLQSD